MIRPFILIAAALLAAGSAVAHEVRPAHLRVAEVGDGRFLVRWKVPAMGERALPIAPEFSVQCVQAAEPADRFAGGAFLRSWYLECPEGIAGTEIRFANLPETVVDVLVRVTFLDGRDYTGLVRPAHPVFSVPARDSETAVFGSYFRIGVEHILFGWDHLLFVLGMVLLVTGARRLLWAVTGFTLAHSLTLALAVFDVVRVPGPPVEAAIALSIVALAAEAVRYHREKNETLAIRAPWTVSMVIGLVHGLGFAGALSRYGLPPYAKAVSLAAFNLGVEAGQILFIAALVLAAFGARRIAGGIVAPARTCAAWSIGICGAFWLVQRVASFYN